MPQKSASEVESRRRIAYLEALSQIQSEIASQWPLDRVLDKVIQSAIDILGESACAVFLLDPHGQTLTCTASKGILCSEYEKADTSGKQSLPERVLQTKQMEMINDYRNESTLRLATLENGKLPGAATAAPILVEHDRLLGVLEVYSDKPRTFDEEELHCLGVLAASVGISVSSSIISADFAVESKRRIGYLETLSRIQMEIASQQSLDQILDIVMQSAIISLLLGEAACAVLLLDPDGQTLTCRACKGIPCSEYDKGAPSGKQSLAERVLQTKKMVVISATRNESDLYLPTLENGRLPGAAATAPILVGQDRLVGVLEVYSVEPRTFDEEEVYSLGVLAGTVGVAVVHANTYAEAGKQRTWLDAVLRAVPSAVLISQKPGDRLALANKKAEELLGQTLEPETPLTEIPAKYGIFELDGSPIPIDRFPLYRASGYGKATDLIEMMIIRPDGERRIVQGNALPMYDESGNISGSVGELEDITRLKAMQEDLEKALSKEHYLAETIQKALIPDIPEVTDGLIIGKTYAPAFAEDRMGGDFFDVFSPNAQQVSLVIGDVSGKGVKAAVLTSIVRRTIRAYSYEDPSPKHLIEKLNDVVASEVAPEEFATLFYGLWDMKQHSLSFVNAGHEPPLYLASSESEAKELPSSGIPIGALHGELYSEHSLKLSSGDRLLLYTDGVTEARGDKDFFGLEAVKDFFVANRHLSPSEFTAQLMDRLKEYSNDHLRDDVAVLLISAS